MWIRNRCPELLLFSVLLLTSVYIYATCIGPDEAHLVNVSHNLSLDFVAYDRLLTACFCVRVPASRIGYRAEFRLSCGDFSYFSGRDMVGGVICDEYGFQLPAWSVLALDCVLSLLYFAQKWRRSRVGKSGFLVFIDEKPVESTPPTRSGTKSPKS